MLAPLVAGEALAREQALGLLHRDARRGTPGRAAFAGRAALVLRPEAVHDEAQAGAFAALLAIARAVAVQLAEARRPGQRQHVEIEIARCTAALAKALRMAGLDEAEQCKSCDRQPFHHRTSRRQGRAILQSGA